MNRLSLDQFYVIETIVESMGLGIIVADTSGKLLTFNEGAKKIFEKKADLTAPDIPVVILTTSQQRRTFCARTTLAQTVMSANQ